MSKVLDKFVPFSLNKKAVDRMAKIEISGKNEPISLNHRELELYELSIRLGIQFSAPQEYYARALDNAQRQLVNALFGDLVVIVREAISAVMDGDRYAALKALEKLGEEMAP